MQALIIEINSEVVDFEIYIKGEIDLNTIDQIEKVLEEGLETNKNILIDMKDVRFIDSTGIGLLVKIYKSLKSKGNSIQIINARENVRKVFRITCLEEEFNMGVE